MEHRDSCLRVHYPHHYLGLQQGVGQLGVLQQHGAGLLGVVLDADLHLLHQLEHLLGGEAGHGLTDGLRGPPRLTGWAKRAEKGLI